MKQEWDSEKGEDEEECDNGEAGKGEKNARRTTSDHGWLGLQSE